MRKSRLAFLSFFSAALMIISPATVLAKPAHGNAKPGPGGTSVVQTGNDVSWPQCGKRLPSGQLFGIVGVNDGLANNTNPCLSAELAWAEGSAGTTAQPKAALYVNTANPGNLGVSDWPSGGNNVYGNCTGGDDEACAYQYGWDMARADVNERGVSAPANFRWWLDVETANSWEANTANNVADLEGMVAYFDSVNASAGLYSTAYQWGKIAGSAVKPLSDLNGLDSWIPGGRKLADAKKNCSLPALTSGGKVTVTQYVASQTDYDYSCM